MYMHPSLSHRLHMALCVSLCPLLIRRPIIPIQYDLISRSLTSDICKDPIAKYGHILSFQVNKNVGEHYSTSYKCLLCVPGSGDRVGNKTGVFWKDRKGSLQKRCYNKCHQETPDSGTHTTRNLDHSWAGGQSISVPPTWPPSQVCSVASLGPSSYPESPPMPPGPQLRTQLHLEASLSPKSPPLGSQAPRASSQHQ